jgi:hypothetical protein
MEMPRIRIAWLLAIVAVVAVDFGAIRAFSDHKSRWLATTDLRPFPTLDDVSFTGILPMANVLAVGLVIGYRCRGSRPFLLGFEAFGATALALYIAGANSLTVDNEVFVWPYVASYIDLVIYPLRKTFGQGWTTVHTLIEYSIMAAWLSLPQVAFALVGGFLSCKVQNR